MPKELDMNAWMTRSTIQFEMFLEQKLELLEEAAELVNLASAEAGLASGSGGDTEGVFQLSEGLRVLPSTFIDDSHRFVESLYITLPTGFGGGGGNDCGNTHGAISQDVFHCTGEGGEDSSGHMPFLYGEASSVGVRQIYNHLIGNNSAENVRTSQGGGGMSFIDLGSGVGKLVVEMAHYHLTTTADAPTRSTPASTFMGIELDRDRSNVGEMALRTELFTSGFDNCALTTPRVELLQGDMFNLLPRIATRNENLEDGASHYLFCCGVGFSNTFVERLCSLIYDTYSPQIQGSALKGCILLFKQHPRGHPLYTQASTQDMITIGTSWMDEAPAVLLKFKTKRIF